MYVCVCDGRGARGACAEVLEKWQKEKQLKALVAQRALH